MTELINSFTRSDWIAIIGIFVSSIVAILLYILSKKIDDKQNIDHTLSMQEKVSELLRNGPRDIELYNAKLYNKRNFEKNNRSKLWGHAFHGAGLYNYNFESVQFVVETVKWNQNKFYRTGCIPYKRILKILPRGDGSTNKPILFVKPRMLQLDKYSIAYGKFIYYPTHSGPPVKPPIKYRLAKAMRNLLQTVRYNLYYRWKKK